MPLVLIFLALILIMAAWNNTQGTLASNLATDVPGFAVWAIAIAVIGGLQWVPGLKTPARWLLALVILVIVLTRGQQIAAGFTDLTSGGSAPAGPISPAASYIANPTTAPSTASVQGQGTTGGGTQQGQGTITTPQAMLASVITGNPELAIEAGMIGFGGVA